MPKLFTVSVTLVVAVLPLAAAWWAQHVMAMAPCELCLWERWPYRVLAVVALATALVPSRCVVWLPAVSVGVAAWAAAVAGLHVGVEQGWWPSPLAACAAPVFHGGTLAEQLASMPVRPAKPCDAPDRLVAWIPVSIATLDFLYACVLGSVATCFLKPCGATVGQPATETPSA